jgi:hypothetical protein
MLGGQQSYAPNGEACLVSSLVKRTGIEEPYAGIPHVRVCGGSVGKLMLLPGHYKIEF